MGRRRARLVILFLVLGCVTSVLVAWSSALWAFSFRGEAWFESEGRHACTIWRAMAHDVIRVFQRSFLSGLWRETRDIRDVPLPAGASWERFDLSKTDHEVLRAGWPLRCLEADITSDSSFLDPGHQRQSRWALRVRPPPAAWAGHVTFDGTVPCRPVPLALVADSAFFAGVWALVAIGVRGLWACRPSARWRRKGWCIRCGYDLRGDFAGGCSECGWNRAGTDDRNARPPV